MVLVEVVLVGVGMQGQEEEGMKGREEEGMLALLSRLKGRY